VRTTIRHDALGNTKAADETIEDGASGSGSIGMDAGDKFNPTGELVNESENVNVAFFGFDERTEKINVDDVEEIFGTEFLHFAILEATELDFLAGRAA
jgi:hypothetical protein